MSLSLKILGNDVSYERWEGRQEILQSFFNKLNPLSKLHNMMDGEEKSLSHSAQYMDSTFSLPLSVGLPLKLMGRGNVVADVRGQLRTDLKSILRSGKGDISWKIHPSAAVNFDGTLLVDAIAIQSIIESLEKKIEK